jgi:hypothetical protein
VLVCLGACAASGSYSLQPDAHPGVRKCGRLQRTDEFSALTRTRSPSLNLQQQQQPHAEVATTNFNTVKPHCVLNCLRRLAASLCACGPHAEFDELTAATSVAAAVCAAAPRNE